MNIVCPKCEHNQSFAVEVKDYKSYVCPSCHSYLKTDYKGLILETEFKYDKKFDKLSKSVVTELNEKIRVKNKTYHIITIIERRDDSGIVHYEYVGLSADDDDIYFSHAYDYFSQLQVIDEKDLEFIDEETVKLSRHKYNLTFIDKCKVINAVGFVFEDLNGATTNSTYINTSNENKFISEELIDGKKEFYSGAYLSIDQFRNYFKNAKSVGYIGTDAQLLFFKLFGLLAVVLVSIFMLINLNNLRKQKVNIEEKFTSAETSNQFIGQSFKLTGNTKKLVFDGISETNNKDLNLWVKLVNETTNEVRESKMLVHYDNNINYASGVTVEFCKIPAGTYHMVFETSSNLNQPIDYNIDYRLMHGDIRYLPLIVALGILFLIGYLIYNNKFLIDGNPFYSNLTHVSYDDILKLYQLKYIIIGGLILFTAYNIYINYLEECTTSTSLNYLEDHTYTGSRTHYYRSYSTDGSGHK